MVDTARHGFTKWAAGFTQSDILLNALLDKLEVKVGLSVKSRTTTAQPGAPTAGDAYIIPGSATGAAWSTFTEHDIAYWDGTSWTAYTPITGWPSWVEDDANGVLFNGTSWTIVSKDLPLDKFDATVDPTVNEDSGDGYSVGSQWINVTDDKAFVLLDAAVGAAVWLQLGSASGAVLDSDFSTAGLMVASDGAGTYAAIKIKHDGTAAPTVDNDTTEGFTVGSRWIDVTNDKEYVCLDNTDGAAVWTETTGSGSGLTEAQVDARVVAVASGVKSWWVPVRMMHDGDGTGVPGVLDNYGGTGTSIQLDGRAFDKLTEERVWFSWRVPDNYDASAGVSFIPYWLTTGTDTTGDVQWELRGLNLSNHESVNQASAGDLCVSQDTPSGTEGQLHIGPESARKYLSSFVPGDLVSFFMMRRTASPDLYDEDAVLHGIVLLWDTDHPTEN